MFDWTGGFFLAADGVGRADGLSSIIVLVVLSPLGGSFSLYKLRSLNSLSLVKLALFNPTAEEFCWMLLLALTRLKPKLLKTF